jgi:hypothetical protein
VLSNSLYNTNEGKAVLSRTNGQSFHKEDIYALFYYGCCDDGDVWMWGKG